MNKKFEIHDKQIKAAKRTGNRVQQEKVKDRAKFAAAKEASKNKAKGKVDEDEAPKKWKDYSVEFHFPEPTELTPPLLQLIEVTFSYPNREDFRLSNVDVGIDMVTRVAIVGPNGAGKSTLLAGDLVPTEGEVRRSQKLRMAGKVFAALCGSFNNGGNASSVSSSPSPRASRRLSVQNSGNLDFQAIITSPLSQNCLHFNIHVKAPHSAIG